MNIGMYQSASSLSALEKWQDIVAQNITSSQNTGYRGRTVNFSTVSAGEVQSDPRRPVGNDGGIAMLFPKVNTGISFASGETQPTRRELDCAIQGEGFFEVQRPDGSMVYTRSGEFRMRPDRTLVTTGGDEVMSTAGAPLVFLPGGGTVVINADGTVFQGETPLGKILVQRFEDNNFLRPLTGGYFAAPEGVDPEPMDEPELLQGYLEGSNVTPLREMVDLVLISRAYESNQKMIATLDQQMGKALEALG